MADEKIFPTGFKEMTGNLPGIDADAFFRAMQADPVVSIRLNCRKKPVTNAADTEAPDIYDAECEAVPWCPTGRYLKERPAFTLDPLLHAGAYYVQDASSMIYRQAMQKILQLPGMKCHRVLDMCAAPGGKTTAMIDALPDGAIVVANEYVGKRRSILEENLAKWGYGNLIVTGSDTADFARCGSLFDVVAVDAPCSGEGMMRKEPEALSQWNNGLICNCATLQREILANAAAALRPGGVLLYSTCTFNTTENEQNAEYIVSELGMTPLQLDFEGVPGECRFMQPHPGGEGTLRFMPHFTKGEGLFFSAFIKEDYGESDSIRYSDEQSRHSGKSRKKGGNRESLPEEELRKLLNITDAVLRENNGVICAMNTELASFADTLRKHTRITREGIPVGVMKGKDLIPAPELALTPDLAKGAYPDIELPYRQAIGYLRREAITLPEGTPKGYVIVKYRGLPLGFAKNIGNRANNLYPAQWRIRS